MQLVRLLTAALILGFALPAIAHANRPNIVLVITDDQGMGDIGALGNPIVRTPAIDALHQESVRLTDFHVDPTCAPTRAALMTGKHSLRTGVWHTIMARNMLPAEETTLAEILKANGYATGLFGKWHLGDNYPFRPQDQGFDRVVMHGGGGVGQTPDLWGNDQFGDTYFVDGIPRPFGGNSTDVWFDEVEAFIRTNASSRTPFFAYVATNAPHSPWRAPAEEVQPYLEMGVPSSAARFYAMITHLDRRLGQLRTLLREQGVDRDTIVIFMTDNGTSLMPRSFSADGRDLADLKQSRPEWRDWTYNAGLSGGKNAVTDGGHRVPFFLHWPGGGFDKGRDIGALTAHFDVLPTLMDLLDLRAPVRPDFDGISLVKVLRGVAAPDRTLVVTNQRVPEPSADRPAQVLTTRWRHLPGPGTLFDAVQDRGQTQNVASQHPDVVRRLRAAYDAWWRSASAEVRPVSRVIIGSEAEPHARLTAHDYVFLAGEDDGKVAWYPGFGDESYGPGGGPAWIGKERDYPVRAIPVSAASAGNYDLELYYHDRPAATVIPFRYAHVLAAGRHVVLPVAAGQASARVRVSLPQGAVDLTAWFSNSEAVDSHAGGERAAAFFVYAQRAN